jgi:hypothetical protein
MTTSYSKRFALTSILIILELLFPLSAAVARGSSQLAIPGSPTNRQQGLIQTAKPDMGGDSTTIPWPTFWAGLSSSKFNSSFTDFGTYGLQSSYAPDYPYWPRYALESPPGSGTEYLFSASLWVGGIVNGDTLVSTGYDGWVLGGELYPDGFGTGGSGATMPSESLADQSMRTAFSDTIQSGVNYPLGPSSIHKPLHISIAQRAYVWNQSPFDNCLVYDITITNVGLDRIRRGYVGMYLDGDISDRNHRDVGYLDDLAGSIRDQGIAYMIDNDGDPVDNRYDPAASPTKALAFKFLHTSFQPTDTTFNWWFPSRASENGNFGPQQLTHLRSMMSGGSGLPGNDADRYFLMRNHEWDFDQVQLATITDADRTWSYPGPAAPQWCAGTDTRLLYSIGPFDLLPDSSIRVIGSFLSVDSVHTDPYIMDYLPIVPDLYVASLGINRIVSAAASADSLANLLLNPTSPPTGVTIHPSIPHQPTSVSWDPWSEDNIDGVNLYLTSIPDSAYVHVGVIPPWYSPAVESLASQLGRTDHASLAALDNRQAYVLSVANRKAGAAGRHSNQIRFRPDGVTPAPLAPDTILFIQNVDQIGVNWHPPTSVSPRQYNVYRFPDSSAYNHRYHRHYSLHRYADVTDSVFRNGSWYYYYALPVFDSVPGSTIGMVDSHSFAGAIYCVTTIDSSGFESDFSPPMTAYTITRSRDIVLITRSASSANFVTFDTVRMFYDKVLQGYDYAIYNLGDSIQGPRCPDADPACFDWRDLVPFRMVIIDDGLFDGVLDYNRERLFQTMSKYLLSGGQLAYFGSFANMSPTPLTMSASPATYPVPNGLPTRFFGVDSLFWVGPLYYENQTPPYVDTQFALANAAPNGSGIPPVPYDSNRTPFVSRLRTYWRANTPPSVSTFVPNSRGVVTHLYQSSTPGTSMNQGQAVGIKTSTDTTTTYLFGFHLWYMKIADAKNLVGWMYGNSPTDVGENQRPELPKSLTLLQNYPNPFNPNTRISFDLPTGSNISLQIYNVMGQVVRTLENSFRSAGHYEIEWDGKDRDGRMAASGIYFYRLQTAAEVVTRKMLLLK